MDDYAIVPLNAEEVHEPISEQNFNRKKLLVIEQGITKLQKTTLHQHEVVAQIENTLKTMISEADLRRAIGLSFQEFENRIEDAFQDSNRKCLAMFSKRDEVSELQAAVSKKVNWSDYQACLKRMADLRQYVDSMAESVFIGHREALESEFAKKADAAWVEKALKGKADFSEVNDVRARLERLEVLVEQNAKNNSKNLEALRAEFTSRGDEMYEKQMALMKEANNTIASSGSVFRELEKRMGSAESRLSSLDAMLADLSKAAQELKEVNSSNIQPRLQSIEDSLDGNETKDSEREAMLNSISARLQELSDSADKRLGDLIKQGDQSKEQLEFLMQATDMIKRRSREMSKTTTERFKELVDDQDRQVQQLASLEREIRKHEREVRAVSRSSKAQTSEGFMRMLPALSEPEPPAPDGNLRLQGVLAELEKIAAGGKDMHAVTWNSSRPPLPVSSAASTYYDTAYSTFRCDASGPEQAAIDSARSTFSSANVRGMYGLSPRTPLPPTGKAPGRKKR
eukprot:TRINITY_DN20709_c0_g1_i1.p1 TRINITY_DN20709_c0_g1~~TRINITY_DN20709_c0_g1_i1.p1  ORF type:complete len:513 (+),score=146.21 TRINITY_DN20709_c0_g1_i1:79-1617(+)